METMMSTSEFREKCFTPTSMPSEQALKTVLSEVTSKEEKLGKPITFLLSSFLTRRHKKLNAMWKKIFNPIFHAS